MNTSFRALEIFIKRLYNLNKLHLLMYQSEKVKMFI
jgi:hypothetical protein